jgi:hypothetical protein
MGYKARTNKKGNKAGKANKAKKLQHVERAPSRGAPPIKIQPGYLVVSTSKVTGGISYDREYGEELRINENQGVQISLHTVKTVDHVEIAAALDALKKKADYAFKKHCAHSAFNWWYADDVSLKALEKEIAELQREERVLNAAAKAVGSARRAHIGIIAGKIDVATPLVAAEIARTICDVLSDVIAAFRTGQVKRVLDDDGKVIQQNALHAPLLRCKNLDRLAVGTAGEAVKIALQHVPHVRAEIIEAIEKDGMEPAEAGARVDLEPFENAITWFEEGSIGTDLVSPDEVAAALQDAMKG